MSYVVTDIALTETTAEHIIVKSDEVRIVMTADTCQPPDETLHGETTEAPLSDDRNGGNGNRPSATSESTVLPAMKAAHGADTACPNCASTEPWGFASWCPECGYYPAAGGCIGPAAAPAEEKEVSLNELIPPWGRVLAAGAVFIFGLSLWARLGVIQDERQRQYWALAQCVIGVAGAVAAHSAAFMFALLKTDRFSPLDFFMRPIAIWKPAIAALPDRVWRVWTLGWGLTTAFCALTIIGGIRYSAIFDDWGFETRAQPTIVQAVVDQARREREGADSLEEAMDDFAGEAGAEDDSLKHYSRTDCLIFGYTTIEEDRISAVLLASVTEGRLDYIGRVSFRRLSAEAQETLKQRFPELERQRSFIDVPFAANWLEPVLMCRIAYRGWNEHGLMQHPRFLQLLADAPVR